VYESMRGVLECMNVWECGGNNDGIKSGRRNAISSPVLACKIRKDY
jgi:hypothetical protein